MSTKFALISNGVADVVSYSPTTEYHPQIAAQFVAVPDEVEVGFIQQEDGSFVAPEPVEEPTPTEPETPEPVEEPTPTEPETPEPVYPTVGPIHFKMLFTPAERLRAKALRASDALLDDFWGLIEDQRADVVSLSLTAVQNAVEYTLQQVKASAEPEVAADAELVALDVAVRKAEILTGNLV